MTGYRSIFNLLKPNYPALLNRIREEIEKREKEFVGKGKETEDSFLWEHSLHVALYTKKICALEKIDPVNPVVAALFHDVGKFDGGHYHRGKIREEERSSIIASEILRREGIDSSDIDLIVSGLKSLYVEEKKSRKIISDIIHDADFLAKSGYLGIANFFTKSALKGQNLVNALSLHLSKELTYASVLANNMRTAAGKKLAERKSKDSLSFFKQLVSELSEAGIIDFVIDEEELPCLHEGKRIQIILATPVSCPTCGDQIKKEISFEQGIKCAELVVNQKCVDCSFFCRISFCLPELLP